MNLPFLEFYFRVFLPGSEAAMKFPVLCIIFVSSTGLKT